MSLYGIRQLADSFRNIRRNTIQGAEEIPESDYRYRPPLRVAQLPKR